MHKTKGDAARGNYGTPVTAFVCCNRSKPCVAGKEATQVTMAQRQAHEGALQEAPQVKAKRRRRCTTCGAPTTNYRCEDCWRRLRGFSCEDVAQGVDPTMAYSGRLKRVRVPLVPDPWKPLGAVPVCPVPDRQAEFFAAKGQNKEDAG